ncbi:unannotated protein [freshwater metagenome]|uniref:Unannotated protein n=1 Tax=freshwater metagenome TaxID=449393 RepID=A0A6J7F7K7_9ZZZZ
MVAMTSARSVGASFALTPTFFGPLDPARLLETRAGAATFDGISAGIGYRTQGSTTQLQVTGRAGVPNDASSVVLNITVTNAAGPGFVTIYPCGSPKPDASSLNYSTGSTIANGVIAKVGTGGKVCLYTSNATDLIADINGYF